MLYRRCFCVYADIHRDGADENDRWDMIFIRSARLWPNPHRMDHPPMTSPYKHGRGQRSKQERSNRDDSSLIGNSGVLRSGEAIGVAASPYAPLSLLLSPSLSFSLSLSFKDPPWKKCRVFTDKTRSRAFR